MSFNPRVSVIIPCFNLGRYLPEALASVRNQTLSDFETIIVDDGSTDAETAGALASAAAPNLRIVRSENQGLAAARNLGIRHARGAYISCLDADDMLEPEWLAFGVDRLERDTGLAFVSHWLDAFGDEQWPWTPERSDLPALLDQNVFNGAALFRREIVDVVGGFDESMRNGCEDWEFWIRVITAGYRGATIPLPLYRYRRRADSMSRAMTTSDTWFQLYGHIIEKHEQPYREHLLDLLLRREWSFAQLCRGIDRVQEELSLTLEPALRERRRELERARARVADLEARQEMAVLQARADALDRERMLAEQRIDALHRSWSWRVTTPLRRAYEVLLRFMKSGRPDHP